MIKRVVAERGNRKAIAMDSISHVDAADAGVGKDDAGIAALGMLEALHVLAATVSHLSARIGDAEDMWQHGVLSHLNASALRGGLKQGERLQDAVGRLLAL